MAFWNIFLGILGSIGTICTLYFGWQTVKLRRARWSLTWDEVQAGSVELMTKAIDQFAPDALVLLSGPGALVGNMAMATLRCFMPVYNILLEDRLAKPFDKVPKECITTSTDKWNIYVPKAIFDEDAYEKLLVFTDCDISGDTNKAVRNLFRKEGIANENIHLTSLVCSKIAQSAKKDIVDDIWLLTDHTTFYFPWGKWY